MTSKEFLNQLSDVEIKDNRKLVIENQYGCKLPDTVCKIISLPDESLFTDNYRVMSFTEIRDADDEYEMDFSNQKLIPLVDCYDFTFIVYDYSNNNYAFFSGDDFCTYNEKNSLSEILE